MHLPCTHPLPACSHAPALQQPSGAGGNETPTTMFSPCHAWLPFPDTLPFLDPRACDPLLLVTAPVSRKQTHQDTEGRSSVFLM
jgi:hypothetical protein